MTILSAEPQFSSTSGQFKGFLCAICLDMEVNLSYFRALLGHVKSLYHLKNFNTENMTKQLA